MFQPKTNLFLRVNEIAIALSTNCKDVSGPDLKIVVNSCDMFSGIHETWVGKVHKKEHAKEAERPNILYQAL